MNSGEIKPSEVGFYLIALFGGIGAVIYIVLFIIFLILTGAFKGILYSTKNMFVAIMLFVGILSLLYGIFSINNQDPNKFESQKGFVEKGGLIFISIILFILSFLISINSKKEIRINNSYKN